MTQLKSKFVISATETAFSIVLEAFEGVDGPVPFDCRQIVIEQVKRVEGPVNEPRTRSVERNVSRRETGMETFKQIIQMLFSVQFDSKTVRKWSRRAVVLL